MKYILASQSQRRKEILNKLGLNFEIQVSDCEEKTQESKPQNIVKDLAKQKAINVYNKQDVSKDFTIIAADTIVYIDGKILGKPKDDKDAFQMLSLLQNNWHTVYTGVYILENIEDSKRANNYFESTRVHMKPLDDIIINKYIESGEPQDKAGAYGYQGLGRVLIDKIEGEKETVIGLPIVKLKKLLNIT